jgi:ParB family chromosome partitioning protein
MKIKYIPAHEIKPYELNAKKHPIKQLEALCKSIEQFGFMKPIVIDNNNVIVAGHGTYEAATTLGKELIPCVVADDLTPTQIKAYRILDNKLSETGYDNELLQADLETFDFDFSEFDIEFEGLNQPDDVAQPEQEKEKELKVVVTFANETNQHDLYEELIARGFNCKIA